MRSLAGAKLAAAALLAAAAVPALLAAAAVPALLAAAAVPADAETAVERGAYLVNGIANCGNCHSPLDPDGKPAGTPLSGGGAIVGPYFSAYPPNLTADPETGLGRWSEDQIVTAIREGRTPDGTMLRPPMPVPFYRGLSDRDAHAIAAYLRSLPPVRNAVPASIYERPTPTSYGGTVGRIPDPDPDDRVVYGRYLVALGHCMRCHTPRDAAGRPDLAHRMGAGGVVFRGGVVSANITSDPVSGIGAWTDRQIKDAMTKGVRPDGSQVAPPMPWRFFATMREADVDAIVAYLRTVPPISERSVGR